MIRRERHAIPTTSDDARRRYGLLGLLRVPTKYLAELWRDIRQGLRMLAGCRGFTVVALLSLSLGIGIGTVGHSFGALTP